MQLAGNPGAPEHPTLTVEQSGRTAGVPVGWKSIASRASLGSAEQTSLSARCGCFNGNASAVLPDIFETRSLRRQDQLEAWRAWFGPILEVAPRQPADSGFAAENHLWRLGGLAVTRTIAPPSHIARTMTSLRHDPVDHWVLSCCPRGAHNVQTARASLEVPARVPFLWSLGEEFEHERTHVDRVQLFLSRDAFRRVAPLLDKACGFPLDTALGHLLGDYMLALERHLPALTEEDLPRLAGAVEAILAATVAPSVERVAIARAQIDIGRMEQVRRAVRTHLRSPLLGPKTLPRLVGISRSNLYRLLEDQGGIARYIQRERLLEAHAAVADPANLSTVSAIAEELCFADASSFGRAFKREFGYTPGEIRSAALARLGQPATLPSSLPTAGGDFSRLLHAF
jgi:AraC-like DNA-binding protein